MAALALLADVAAAPSGAAAQLLPDPVDVTVEGLFGRYPIPPSTEGTALITLTNRRAAPLSGIVVLEVDAWSRGKNRHELPLELPARGVRQVRIGFHYPDSGTVVVRYEDGSRRLGQGFLETGYDNERGIVIVAEEAHLRPHLGDLEVDVRSRGSLVSPVVGVAPLDRTSGDPILPRQAAAWEGTHLVIVRGSMLPRIGTAERLALADWVRGGGRLLVMPRGIGDLGDPLLRELVGELRMDEQADLSQWQGDLGTVVPEARSRGLIGELPFGAEPFGGSAPVGFGRVYVSTYDGASEAFASRAQTRQLVFRILEHPDGLGAGRIWDSRAGAMPYMGLDGSQSLRAALDPNESFRPALAFVAILLLLYVFLVGPLNFAWVGRKNRPPLALLSTPIIALGTLLALFAIGYVGKGISMRQRSVGLVEMVEGQRAAPRRTYRGLFLTRPASFDLPSPPRGSLALALASAGMTQRCTHEGAAPALRGIHGDLWETIFIEEEQMQILSASIHFERDGSRLAAVVNGLDRPLRDALILDASGSLFPVGDVPPGERRPISAVASATVIGTGYDPLGDGRTLAAQLGFSGKMQLDLVTGLLNEATQIGLVAGLTQGGVPILLARLDSPEEEPIGGLFSEEASVQLLRLVPSVSARSVVLPTQATLTSPVNP